jgi:hypothetical protein
MKTQLGKDGKPFNPKRWATWAAHPRTSSAFHFNREQEPSARKSGSRTLRNGRNKIPCPHCFERIGRATRMCPHCGGKIR